MLNLHNKKGAIIGQIQKDFLREDVVLLGSDINQTTGVEWQTLSKLRKSNVGFPVEYAYALGLHTAFEREPFIIEMSESETRQKLKSWGLAANEIENLLKITPEGK